MSTPSEPRDRVENLLKLYVIFDGQEHAIKNEENGWVRNHWAFYLALAGLAPFTSRVLLERFDAGDIPLGVQLGVCGGMILMTIMSLVATQLFLQQMLQMRWTYYGVRERLLRVVRALALDDAAAWGLENPLNEKPVTLISEIQNEAQWRALTKPNATFKGRLAHLLLGHFAVLCVYALALIAMVGSWAFFVFAVGASISAFWGLWAYKSVLDADKGRFVNAPPTPGSAPVAPKHY